MTGTRNENGGMRSRGPSQGNTEKQTNGDDSKKHRRERFAHPICAHPVTVMRAVESMAYVRSMLSNKRVKGKRMNTRGKVVKGGVTIFYFDWTTG